MKKLKELTLERIKILLDEAESSFKKNPSLSNRYVKIARRLAMKSNLKLPSTLKRKFCKYCYNYLKPGINSRTRIAKSRIIIYCNNCKNFTRIPLKPKRIIS